METGSVEDNPRNGRPKRTTSDETSLNDFRGRESQCVY